MTAPGHLKAVYEASRAKAPARRSAAGYTQPVYLATRPPVEFRAWVDSESGVLRFVLPYPPTLNNLYTTVRGRRVLSREGREYKARVKSIATGIKRIERGDVGVSVQLYRAEARGDIDNTFKALLDSMTGVAYRDDSQIQCIHAERYTDGTPSRAEVVVRRVGVSPAAAVFAEGGRR